jgi:hypothetical protein
MKLWNNFEKSFDFKLFVKLVDQKLMKLLIVEKGLDLNQNFRTREAEQNKWSCWIKLIVEKGKLWIGIYFTPEAVAIWEKKIGLG